MEAARLIHTLTRNLLGGEDKCTATKKCEIALLIGRKVRTGGHLTGTCL